MEQFSDSYETLTWYSISLETLQRGVWQYVSVILQIV